MRFDAFPEARTALSKQIGLLKHVSISTVAAFGSTRLAHCPPLYRNETECNRRVCGVIAFFAVVVGVAVAVALLEAGNHVLDRIKRLFFMPRSRKITLTKLRLQHNKLFHGGSEHRESSKAQNIKTGK